MLRTLIPLGTKTERGSVIALVTDLLGKYETEVIAPTDGVVIGWVNLPLVHEVEALFHIARFSKSTNDIIDRVEAFTDDLKSELPLESPVQP